MPGVKIQSRQDAAPTYLKLARIRFFIAYSTSLMTGSWCDETIAAEAAPTDMIEGIFKFEDTL
ncbi:MAG: hypothetical protein V3U54_01180 [Thermodesulfobacteriota bacterium]